MNKLLKNYEQVFRRRQLLSNFAACQVLRPAAHGRSQATQLTRMQLPGDAARSSFVYGQGRPTGPDWYMREGPLSYAVVRLVMVRCDNLQFVHTKRLICSQICARVESPGTFVKMHKRDDYSSPIIPTPLPSATKCNPSNHTSCPLHCSQEVGNLPW